VSELLEDVKTLRERVRQKRRLFARSSMGRVARALADAMDEFHRMRAQGVSRDDAVKGLETVLRDVIPQSRFPDSRCAGCDNTGWRETVCTHQRRCGRESCSLAEPSWEHRYVVPCECLHGDRHRPKPARGGDDALVAVGKTKKRGFTRLGR